MVVTVQEKGQCVLWYDESKSFVTVWHNFIINMASFSWSWSPYARVSSYRQVVF